MLERIVKFSPGFDKRDKDPSKNYGVGSVNCWMILKGDKGAVQFAFMTGMYPEHVMKEWKTTGYSSMPMGIDVGYHSPIPQYKGQKDMKCHILPSGRCYYDGSGLQAEKWLKVFIEEGEDKIWQMLEERYNQLFNQTK